MGKMTNLILVSFAVFMALWMFTGQVPGGAIIQLAINPYNWSNLSLIDWITGTLTATGAAMVVGGLITNNDLGVFGGVSTILLSFGASFYQIWNNISAKPEFMGDKPWIAILFISPIILMYFMVLLDFWRGKD